MKPSKTQADRHIHTPDMLTHRGVHDPCAVRPDGVGNVSDVDGVQMLVVTCLLNEDLSENKVSTIQTTTCFIIVWGNIEEAMLTWLLRLYRYFETKT